MSAKAKDCLCLEAITDRIYYGLETDAGQPNRHPGFAEMVLEEELVVRCRRCDRRWVGQYIVGGGIYGDTIWYLDSDRGT